MGAWWKYSVPAYMANVRDRHYRQNGVRQAVIKRVAVGIWENKAITGSNPVAPTMAIHARMEGMASMLIGRPTAY